MPNVVSRFARSWQLIQASCDVLRADNALLILPALSGLATTALAAGFAALAISGVVGWLLGFFAIDAVIFAAIGAAIVVPLLAKMV
jgi:hypothetical protein